MTRIAFVSREVYPFDSAGLGNYAAFAAATLAADAEVTIVTTARHEQRYRELRAANDPRLAAGVRYEFVPEPTPDEAEYWYTALHLWSARACEALCRLYPDGGPDLAEFPDYLGEACVTAQAVQTRDRRLRHTRVCVRAYTTSEICAVLDGYTPSDRDGRLVFELERFALRHCDHFLWPGGGVLDAFQRFYGADGIAAPVEVAHVVSTDFSPAERTAGDGITRMLYLGRLERRKGVSNLIRAATALAGDDWSLTLIGADTPTAPLGGSLREHLELMIADDPRIRLLDRVPHERLGEHLAAADFLVSPSLWECWPNTILEAFQHDRPVLATPVGGHLGMVEPGTSGWLSSATGADALSRALVGAIRTPPDERPPAGAPRRRFEQLTDPEPVRETYLELASRGRPRAATDAAPRADPLVSVVIPYFRMERFVGATLESVAAQTYPRIETIIVNDGSLRDEDAGLAELADRHGAALVTQPNSGLGQARNLGVDLARGRYILPLDPDDVLLPRFVERAVEVLEWRPELAYVTAWTEFIDERGAVHGGGYRPLGNVVDDLESENLAGSAMALFRRRVFERGLRYSEDLTSYEDWLMFMRLRDAGAVGHVIPETLLRYRVRRASMLRGVGAERLERLRGELAAHKRETEMRWTPSSA